jgi:hypothetical protein
MTLWQWLVTHIHSLLALAVMVGVLRRGRVRLCWSFPAYLAAFFASSALVAVWPGKFFTEGFWVVQQTAFNALKVAVALELGMRVFHAFPTADANAKRSLVVGMFLTALALVGLPAAASGYRSFIDVVQPRVLQGTIWMLNGLAILIVWYRLPVHAFHKAILAGFVPYLLVFVTLLRLCQRFDWNERVYAVFSVADPAAFALVLAYWAWAAWRPDPAPQAADQPEELWPGPAWGPPRLGQRPRAAALAG